MPTDFKALTSSPWHAGQIVSFQITLENHGTSNAPANDVRVDLHPVSGAAVETLGTHTISGVGANSVLVTSFDLVVPSNLDGTFTLSVTVDAGNAVAEADESNNTLPISTTIDITSGQPDLVAFDLEGDVSVWPVGQEITLTLIEQNVGTARAGSHKTQLWLSLDTTLDQDDSPLGELLTFDAIDSGATGSATSTFIVPAVPDGDYFLYIIVDVENDVAESDETNNVARTVDPIPIGAPDLIAESLTGDIPDTWQAGDEITVSLTEKNQGNLPADEHLSQLFLSSDADIDAGDTPLGDPVFFDLLEAGATATENVTFAVPSVADGDYLLGVLVDVDDDVVERDETNNTLALQDPITVTSVAPDLVATQIDAPLAWQIGQQLTVTLTEKNQGGAAAGAHETQLFLSPDTNIDPANDTPLGSPLQYGPLDAGASGNADVTFTVPDLAEGDYFIGIFVDVNGAVVESNEDNNIARTTDPIAVMEVEVINAADSLALVTLFNATGGQNWANSTGWGSGPVATWFGITVEEGRVTGLDLSGNQLSGTLPGEIGDLTALRALDLRNNELTGDLPSAVGNLSALETLHLQDNQFTGLPDLSGLAALDVLEVQNNRLTFEDIEPNVGVASTFTYAPQSKVGNARTVTITEGDALTIAIPVGGSSNTYQWFKDGTALQNATTDTYSLSSATLDDEGEYVLVTTNTVVPELTIESHPVQVDVLEAEAYPATVQLSVSQSFGDPTRTTSYRLVGLAGAGSRPLAQVIPGTPGETWTAYHDDGSEPANLREFDGSGVFTFAPGRGFWLLSRQTWTFSETVATVPLNADGATISIPLHDGWNIISNPADKDIPWAAVQQANGDLTAHLWRWNGSFSQSSMFTSAKTGQAYYFFNATGLSQLRLPYFDANATPTEMPLLAALTLAVYHQNQRASAVRVGVTKTPASGEHNLDQVAPPGVFETASLRVLGEHPEQDLAEAYRPGGADGYRFDLVLRAPAGEPLELHAEDFRLAPEHVAVVVDARGRRYDLAPGAPVRIHAAEPNEQLTLLLGSPAFVSEAQTALVPERLELLGNYPNPFNPETVIEYTLPSDSRVRLVVFDVLGRPVRTLVNASQPAGFHEAVWDGRDERGMAVASGMYLYRLEAEGASQTRTMLLLK